MLVQFIEGRSAVSEVRNKETREIVALKQECYFHLPGAAFPVQGQIRVESPVKPGHYNFNPVYKIGRFGDLEIDPFKSPVLQPARPEEIKRVS